MTLWNTEGSDKASKEKKDAPKIPSSKESFKDSACAFIFKKKIFLRDDEREMNDVVAKNLVYIQVSLRTVKIFDHFNIICRLKIHRLCTMSMSLNTHALLKMLLN